MGFLILKPSPSCDSTFKLNALLIPVTLVLRFPTKPSMNIPPAKRFLLLLAEHEVPVCI